MIEIKGKAKRELLSSKPSRYTYDSVAGSGEDAFLVTAVTREGEKIKLRTCGEYRYASNAIPDEFWDCKTVAEQLNDLEREGHEVVRLEVFAYCDYVNKDYWHYTYIQEDFAESLPECLNGTQYKAYCVL